MNSASDLQSVIVILKIRILECTNSADLKQQHYPFLTANITFSHVVDWFVQHGVARDGDGIRDLESFARARHNRAAGKDDPTLRDFETGGTPHNEGEMLRLVMGSDFVTWKEVRHAALQPDVSSAYPPRPADTMEDIHSWRRQCLGQLILDPNTDTVHSTILELGQIQHGHRYKFISTPLTRRRSVGLIELVTEFNLSSVNRQGKLKGNRTPRVCDVSDVDVINPMINLAMFDGVWVSEGSGLGNERVVPTRIMTEYILIILDYSEPT
ncbi:hypothetical protein C8R46DRAFT_1025861 [Mycena filopes]|nr:hypothetical protein C8R46DRAFT_1025861 [Mycena filopes]